ncbi:uncharacterized protein A4U43_C08F18900 [Asparagus officinalis]|nr:uncharacterized protein A4U43_C08F18900 [Asparagus officinalis]
MIRSWPPPANLATDFELHQCVEAFYNVVWWKGVVTKVLGRDGDLLYSVCFPASREEFQFKESEIWRQMKWVKGECINVEDGKKDYEKPGRHESEEKTKVPPKGNRGIMEWKGNIPVGDWAVRYNNLIGCLIRDPRSTNISYNFEEQKFEGIKKI